MAEVSSRTLRAGAVLAGGLALCAAPAAAQTVGSVFGPEVNEGDRAAEWRSAFAPGEDGEDDRHAHRLHYEQALNGSVRLRGIVQGSTGDRDELEFNFVQAELLWQTVERTPGGYSSAFRFDARLNEGDDRANQLGVNWTNQWVFGEGWRLRGLVLLDADVGERARDGLFVETRLGLTRRLDNGLRIGVHSHNDYGNTDAGFGSFEEQEHRLGPVVSGSFGEGWSWFFGSLFGLSDAADDVDLQLRIGRDF